MQLDGRRFELSGLGSNWPSGKSGAFSARLSRVEQISSVEGLTGVGEVVVMIVHSEDKHGSRGSCSMGHGPVLESEVLRCLLDCYVSQLLRIR